jgi:hypothetical protein
MARCGRRFQPLSTGAHVGRTKVLEKMLDLIRAKRREEARRPTDVCRGLLNSSRDEYSLTSRCSSMTPRPRSRVPSTTSARETTETRPDRLAARTKPRASLNRSAMSGCFSTAKHPSWSPYHYAANCHELLVRHFRRSLSLTSARSEPVSNLLHRGPSPHIVMRGRRRFGSQ